MIRFRKFCIKLLNERMRMMDIVFRNLCITLYASTFMELSMASISNLGMNARGSSTGFSNANRTLQHLSIQKTRLQRHILTDESEGFAQVSVMIKNMLNEGVDPWFYFWKFWFCLITIVIKKERLNLVMISTNSHVAIEFLFLKKPKILWRLQLAQAIIFHCWMRELKLN